MLRKASCFEEALHLSKKHGLYAAYLRMQIEDQQNYREALEYIQQLPGELASSALQLYGKDLISHLTEETTSFLIDLCTPNSEAFTPNSSSSEDVGDEILNGCCAPDNFIHCFVNHPQQLKQFLGAMLALRSDCDSTLWNTSLELFLRRDLVEESMKAKFGDACTEEMIEETYQKDVMAILQNPKANYDDDQALILVQMVGFKEGKLYLYRKLQMYSMLLKYYMELGNTEKVIEVCKEYGDEDQSLWIQLLTFYSEMDNVDTNQLVDVLQYMYDNKIVPSLMALQILARNKTLNLGILRRYILMCIREKQQLEKEDETAVNKLKTNIQEMEEEMNSVKTYPPRMNCLDSFTELLERLSSRRNVKGVSKIWTCLLFISSVAILFTRTV